MKRSEINRIMQEADEFIRSRGFHLPPFAYWTPDEWREKGEEVRAIVDGRLGWDITDFGEGDFENLGLFLFTLRNGSLEDLERGKGRVYAEKLLICEPAQITPFHFHWNKTEDIINRAGGTLKVTMYNATEEEEMAETEVRVMMDGIEHAVPAGGTVELQPGESITLEPYRYHKFWVEGERTLLGEVSTVNDDEQDNRFYEPIGRFSEIEEDEPPLYLLVQDYDQYYQA